MGSFLPKLSAPPVRELSAFLKARSALRPELELEEVAGDAVASAGHTHVNPQGWIFVCHSPCAVLREAYGELFAGDLKLFSRMQELEGRAARAAASGNKQELFEVARDADRFDAELAAFRTPERAGALAQVESLRATVEALPGISSNAETSYVSWTIAPYERILAAATGRNAVNRVARPKSSKSFLTRASRERVPPRTCPWSSFRAGPFAGRGVSS